MSQPPITTAVILAAGMGMRLGPVGTTQPKGLLRLGPQPIITESIAQLRHHGITRIVIVTGHRADQLAPLAATASDIVLVHNPRYAESGSMYSLYCARTLLDEPFLLLESDLVYEPRAIAAVLDAPGPDVILLSGPTGAGDEVYAAGDGHRLAGLSKDRAALPNVVGELVGISKISVPLFTHMLAAAERAFQTTLQVAYETDMLIAAAQTIPVAYELIPDLVWTEIDDTAQLERARLHIYPEVVRRRNARSPITSTARRSSACPSSSKSST